MTARTSSPHSWLGFGLLAACLAAAGTAGASSAAGGHGGRGPGHSVHGHGRAGRRGSHGRRVHPRGGDGAVLLSPACTPQDAACQLRVGGVFTDPSSTSYVPYCDPGSLYYDPESCEEALP